MRRQEQIRSKRDKSEASERKLDIWMGRDVGTATRLWEHSLLPDDSRLSIDLTNNPIHPQNIHFISTNSIQSNQTRCTLSNNLATQFTKHSLKMSNSWIYTISIHVYPYQCQCQNVQHLKDSNILTVFHSLVTIQQYCMLER